VDKNSKNSLWPLALAVLLQAGAALAHPVVGITDGDTLTLLVDQRPVKIRIHGIDAPERRQPFGAKSRQSLSELCWGKDATFQKTGKSWNRVTAHLYCDGVNAGTEQVRRGMAWTEPRYNRDPALPELQERAREARRGLWAGEPVAPWEWRQEKVSGGKGKR
jgi:micrococcal nuclease